MSDKSQTPTGVFVRLPLSDNEKMALTSGVKMGGSIEQGLLAIGTPVAGGDLAVIGFQLTEDGDSYGIFETEKEANSEGWQTFEEQTWSTRRAVLETDAQAAIAALEAEVQEEQRISNLRGEFIDRWINTCAQKDEQIDGLKDEVGRLREALEEIEMGIDALSSEEDDGGRMAASEMKRQALEVVRSEIKALKGPEA